MTVGFPRKLKRPSKTLVHEWSGKQNTNPRRQTKRHAFMALSEVRSEAKASGYAPWSLRCMRTATAAPSGDGRITRRHGYQSEWAISTAARRSQRLRCVDYVDCHLGSEGLGRRVGDGGTGGSVWWSRFFRSHVTGLKRNPGGAARRTMASSQPPCRQALVVGGRFSARPRRES